MDERALKAASIVCNELKAELRMHDVGTFKGKILAYFKGVKDTPTIVVGKTKMEGIPERKRQVSLLK